MGNENESGKPTPGPWYAWENDGVLGVGKRHSNEADILHAVSESNRPMEEDSANMRLCASAPDLLDALIRARDDLNNAAFLIRKQLGDHHWLYGIEKGKKIADEAIALARGAVPMTAPNLAPRNDFCEFCGAKTPAIEDAPPIKGSFSWDYRHYKRWVEAMSWPCWYFLPHGADTDKNRILRQRTFGIVFHDRALKRLTQDYDA